MYWGINYKCSVPIASTGFSVLLASFSVYREKGINQYRLPRVSQGFWGTREHWQNIEGNKRTLQNSKNYSTKTFGKCVGTWEHSAILEGNKETRTPQGDPRYRVFSIKRPAVKSKLGLGV